MAHYAFLDSNLIVTRVIVGPDENDLPEGVTSWEDHYGQMYECQVRRTSYNTHASQHTLDGTPFRGNYAGIGYTYDPDLDAFIPPQPFPSWTLNTLTVEWEPPTPKPDDGELYLWEESSQEWLAI